MKRAIKEENAVHYNQFKLLQELTVVRPDEYKIEPPLPAKELAELRTEMGFGEHPDIVTQSGIIPDGIYVTGILPVEHEVVSTLLTEITDTVNQVKDGHIQDMGLIDLNLLRQVWIQSSLSNDDVKINIVTCFRFTMDECPVARQMLEQVEKKLQSHFGAHELNVDVTTVHAGSQWKITDVQDERFTSQFG